MISTNPLSPALPYSTMNEPLVSIIVPVYNRESFVRETVQSIISQTYKSLEIILVDDGSTDSSLQILRDFERRDNRIKVIEQNHGYAYNARNVGMKIAKGKYLSFLDSDDLFEQDMIELMVSQAEAEHAQVVICKADTINPKGERSPLTWQLNAEFLSDANKQNFSVARDAPEGAFFFCVGWAWDKLFLTSYIQSLEIDFPPLKLAEDGPFVYPAVAMAPVVTIIDKVCVHYRISGQQETSGSTMSQNPTACLGSARYMYERLTKLSAPTGVLDSCLCWMAHYICWTFEMLPPNARKVLLSAISDGFDETFNLTKRINDFKSSKSKSIKRVLDNYGMHLDNYQFYANLSSQLKQADKGLKIYIEEMLNFPTLLLDNRDFQISCQNGELKQTMNYLKRRKVYYKILSFLSFGRKKKKYKARLNDTKQLLRIGERALRSI